MDHRNGMLADIEYMANSIYRLECEASAFSESCCWNEITIYIWYIHLYFTE